MSSKPTMVNNPIGDASWQSDETRRLGARMFEPALTNVRAGAVAAGLMVFSTFFQTLNYKTHHRGRGEPVEKH